MQVISILYLVRFLDESQEYVHGMEIGKNRVFNLTSWHCFVRPTVNGEECKGFAIPPAPRTVQGKNPVPAKNTLFLVPPESKKRADFHVIRKGGLAITLSFEI